MAKDNHSAAQRKAVAKYQAKTFTKITIALRNEEDADMIEAFKEARTHEISYRDLLRELFDNQK